MVLADTAGGQFAADQVFLRECLSLLLQEQGLQLETALGADIRLVFTAPRKLLSLDSLVTSSSQHQIPSGIWALQSLHIARYCAPAADALLIGHVALSVECFICALDLLDDVEDDDQTPLRQELGDARVLNVATALLALASQCLLATTRYGLSADRACALLTALHQQCLHATHGQHHDLLAEHQDIQEARPEDCLSIIEQKSGSLVRLACLLSALAVSAPDDITDLFAQAGTLIGIAYQLDNDAHDLSQLLHVSPAETGYIHKTDLARGKKTLPIVLAHQRYTSFLQNIPSSADSKKRTEQEQALHTQAYQEAIKASIAVSLYYRSRAEAIIQQIEAHCGVSLPPSLRFLLSLDNLP